MMGEGYMCIFDWELWVLIGSLIELGVGFWVSVGIPRLYGLIFGSFQLGMRHVTAV